MPFEQKKIGKTASPFLRWAGGKAWLLPYISRLLAGLDFSHYHEPFLGSGAVFFALPGHHKSFLSDANQSLILTYQAVKDEPVLVYNVLTRLKNTKEEYYMIRSRKYRNPIAKAAQFIYLNQTSYNGLYRVNTRGTYNVPYGYRQTWKYDRERLVEASISLNKQDATLSHQDFAEALAKVKPGDLVFLDPPYTVSQNNENGFIEYNEKIFSLDDQRRLRRCIDRIRKKKAYYLLTNACHPEIFSIFHTDDACLKFPRYSSIGGKGAQRRMVDEYVFTNIINSSTKEAISAN